MDETGQDTASQLLLVSVVVTERERDDLIRRLEDIERVTGKGRRKWLDAREAQRIAYISAVLQSWPPTSQLCYALYQDTTNHLAATILTIARAISTHAHEDYKATVFIDGLQKSQIPWVGTELRHLHIRTTKVRGVRNEEANALMRLADGLCGFVRAALAGREELVRLLETAKRDGYLREL